MQQCPFSAPVIIWHIDMWICHLQKFCIGKYLVKWRGNSLVDVYVLQFPLEHLHSKHDITCHSKSRRNKKKKIPLCNNEEVEMDLSAMEYGGLQVFISKLFNCCFLIFTVTRLFFGFGLIRICSLFAPWISSSLIFSGSTNYVTKETSQLNLKLSLLWNAIHQTAPRR